MYSPFLFTGLAIRRIAVLILRTAKAGGAEDGIAECGDKTPITALGQ